MSYINVDFKLSPELEKQIEEEVVKSFHEHILNNSVEFKKLIQSCILGQIRSQVNQILQDKEYRKFMIAKIEEQLGMKNANTTELY